MIFQILTNLADDHTATKPAQRLATTLADISISSDHSDLPLKHLESIPAS